VSRICRRRKSSDAAGTTSVGPVRNVAEAPIESVASPASCMSLAILSPSDLAIFTSPTHSIVASSATSISTRTWTIWLYRSATIHTGLSPRQCDWSWRTVCLTEQRPGIYGVTTAFLSLLGRFKTGLKRRGKKAQDYVVGEYLDVVLRDFSGYVAADELYDGPFCVLSIVDNRTFHRLIYEVLDQDPTHEDILRLFRRFRALLEVRRLHLKGITTDGSQLYPEPIAQIFGDVSHQICEFHVIAELTKAILKAVARVRRELKATMPKLRRGRPSSAAQKRAARKKQRIQKKITNLFEGRYLFVKHHMTPGEKKRLTRITGGFPHLRTLREIMNEVYRLFDRRCRTDTALAKLARLRCRVRRFKKVGTTLKKIFSPNLDKALTFLDDSLLPSTSNAVERGNRRHNKMQKSVYRVRSHKRIEERVALDMLRDDPSGGRNRTTATLHRARAG